MNHPVGNRYGDRLIPLGPNSRSDGSIVESKARTSSLRASAVSVICFSVPDTACAALTKGTPVPAQHRRRSARSDVAYFYYFRHYGSSGPHRVRWGGEHRPEDGG